jgi:hypothetical protein
VGTSAAIHDARRREFLPIDDDDDFAFPVQPARYAPFLAVQRAADPDSFGPLRATEDDRSRRFWVPLHKLFSGPECLAGLDLAVRLSAAHVNQSLQQFHTGMKTAGFDTGWDAPQTDQFPFVIEGDVLASLWTNPDHGSGWVMPAPHPLVEPAEHDGKPLGFYFSKELAASVYITSLQIVPAPPFSPLGPERTQALPENIVAAGADIPEYLTSIDPDAGRSVPQFLNIRYQLGPDGAEVNLNDSPNIVETVTEGGYWARHFYDYGCDGWVAVRCPELDGEIPLRVPSPTAGWPPTSIFRLGSASTTTRSPPLSPCPPARRRGRVVCRRPMSSATCSFPTARPGCSILGGR